MMKVLRNNVYKQRKGLEMKQLPIILLVASITLVNVLAATVVISKVNTRADTIDVKLLELDSRRNAQYGIIKKCIADPQKCEGK